MAKKKLKHLTPRRIPKHKTTIENGLMQRGIDQFGKKNTSNHTDAR